MDNRRFIIHNGKRPLSYFFDNVRDGKIKDIIGFSNKSYMIFYSEKEAKEYIYRMNDRLRDHEMNLRLFLDTCKVVEKLKICEVID